MGCGRTCPGSRSRTWDLWAKPGTKPAGSTTNPPEHRHPQACEPETGAWCWKPWSRGHVSHSVTAAGSGQMQARSKASAQLLKEEQGLWCQRKGQPWEVNPTRASRAISWTPEAYRSKQLQLNILRWEVGKRGPGMKQGTASTELGAGHKDK